MCYYEYILTKLPCKKTLSELNRYIYIYLKGREMFLIKLVNRSINPRIDQTLTNLTILQATPDLIPILITINPLLQPIRIIPQPVLLIPPAGNSLAGAGICHHKGENGETEEDHDEDEHDEEVDPEKPSHAAARADEAGEGDDGEEDSEGDDRLF